MNEPAIGIIGGSGLYHLEGFSNLAEHKIDTPFGAPSDSIVSGTIFGRSVYFLPRHGRGHRILPHELNHRNWFDVVGMTNLPEAKLAREAEIALATMAMITDYDCWKVEEEAVSVQTVIGHLLANAETAKKALERVIPEIPREANWPEHHALDSAIITDRKLWPAATIKKLGPIIERFL